jgi:hypothetical protein
MLSVEIKKSGIISQYATIRIKHILGKVFFCLNSKQIELSIIDAVNVGLKIAKAKLEKSESFNLKVNGESIELPENLAIKVSTGLLRKADQADRYQRSIK